MSGGDKEISVISFRWNVYIITLIRFLLSDVGLCHSAVIATLFGTAFFGSSINFPLAAEKSPFIYFATSDPFLKPGQAPTRNDITIFGGPFVKDAFGGGIHVRYAGNHSLQDIVQFCGRWAGKGWLLASLADIVRHHLQIQGPIRA